ncbi:MAG TPA: FAD-dependent oxidoreductase [Kineosporiaceae bacterium]|nr:FAD-dependent oxidoreductase [Kineosporiaceae bacterium]
MRTAVVGAGPTGLYTAIALARRGHEVTVVDRDPGPQADGSWNRRGVMQFHHPHAFRGQVVEALAAEMPEVLDDLLADGAEPATLPDQPGRILGLRCRRLTFEKALRSAATKQDRLTLRTAHVDGVSHHRGRAVGITVDGSQVLADLVLDASGRAGRLTDPFRGPAEGGDCGIAYVSRQYQLIDGAQPGPLSTPIALVAGYPGYLVIVFAQDNRTFSTLIVRPGTDRELAGLRDPRAFDAAARAIPALATWTDPGRSRPITPVLPGGRLYNSYRGQLDADGRVALSGLIFVGDAVCTTNPAAGRGVATSLMQARQLLRLLEEHRDDATSCSLAFDSWCTENIKPWFSDHVHCDAESARRWAGHDVDLSRRLPSDLIAAAAEVDPSLFQTVGPYLGMVALPSTLDAVEPRAREIYAAGWRPPVPDGPTRDELAELVHLTTLAGAVNPQRSPRREPEPTPVPSRSPDR